MSRSSSPVDASPLCDFATSTDRTFKNPVEQPLPECTTVGTTSELDIQSDLKPIQEPENHDELATSPSVEPQPFKSNLMEPLPLPVDRQPYPEANDAYEDPYAFPDFQPVVKLQLPRKLQSPSNAQLPLEFQPIVKLQDAAKIQLSSDLQLSSKLQPVVKLHDASKLQPTFPDLHCPSELESVKMQIDSEKHPSSDLETHSADQLDVASHETSKLQRFSDVPAHSDQSQVAKSHDDSNEQHSSDVQNQPQSQPTINIQDDFQSHSELQPFVKLHDASKVQPSSDQKTEFLSDVKFKNSSKLPSPFEENLTLAWQPVVKLHNTSELEDAEPPVASELDVKIVSELEEAEMPVESEPDVEMASELEDPELSIESEPDVKLAPELEDTELPAASEPDVIMASPSRESPTPEPKPCATEEKLPASEERDSSKVESKTDIELASSEIQSQNLKDDPMQETALSQRLKKECDNRNLTIKLRQLDLEEWMCPVDLKTVDIDTFFRTATSALVLLNKIPLPKPGRPRGGGAGRGGRRGGRRKRKKLNITRNKSKPKPVVHVEPIIIDIPEPPPEEEPAKTSPASIITSPSTCAAPEPKKFPCLECDKSFARKVSLNHHVYTKHGTSNMVQCQLCQKWLLDQCSLAYHTKVVHPTTTNGKTAGQDHDKSGSTPRSMLEDEFRSDPEGCLPFSPSSNDPPSCSKCGRTSLLETDGFEIHKECVCSSQLFPKEFSGGLKNLDRHDGPVPLSSPPHDADLNLSSVSSTTTRSHKKVHAKVYRKQSLDDTDSEKDDLIQLTSLKNCAIPNDVQDYMGSVIQHRGYNNAKSDFWNTCPPETKTYSPPSFTSLQPVNVTRDLDIFNHSETSAENKLHVNHTEEKLLDISSQKCVPTANDLSILDNVANSITKSSTASSSPMPSATSEEDEDRRTPSPLQPSAAEVMDAVMRGIPTPVKTRSKSPAAEGEQLKDGEISSDDSDATIINQDIAAPTIAKPVQPNSINNQSPVAKHVPEPIITDQPIEPLFTLDAKLLEGASDATIIPAQQQIQTSSSAQIINGELTSSLVDIIPTAQPPQAVPTLPDLSVSSETTLAQPVSVITTQAQQDQAHSVSVIMSSSQVLAPTGVIVTSSTVEPGITGSIVSLSEGPISSEAASDIPVVPTGADLLVPTSVAASTAYTSVITGPTSIVTTNHNAAQIVPQSTMTTSSFPNVLPSTINPPQILTTATSTTAVLPNAVAAASVPQQHLLNPMYASPMFSHGQYLQQPAVVSPGTPVSPGSIITSPGGIMMQPGAQQATKMHPLANPMAPQMVAAGAPQHPGMLSPTGPSPMLAQGAMMHQPGQPQPTPMMTPTSTPTMVIPQTLMQDGQMTRQNVLVIQPDMYQPTAVGGLGADPYSEVLQEPTSGRSSPDNIGSDLDDLIIFHNDTLPKADDPKKKAGSSSGGKSKPKGKKVDGAEEIQEPEESSVTMCRICDGISKALHYNAQICTSCKIFFSSTVKTNHDASFVCTNKTSDPCKIRYKNRKNCMYCRFQRCLAIGMSRDAVHEETAAQEERANKRKRVASTSNSSTINTADIAEMVSAADTKPATALATNTAKKKPPPKKKKKESSDDSSSSSNTPDTPQPVVNNPQQPMYSYPMPVAGAPAGMMAYPPGQYIPQYICVNAAGQMVPSAPAYIPSGVQMKPGMMPMYIPANHKGPMPQMMTQMVPMAANPAMGATSMNPAMMAGCMNPAMVANSMNPAMMANSMNPAMVATSTNPAMVSANPAMVSANPAMVGANPVMVTNNANPAMVTNNTNPAMATTTFNTAVATNNIDATAAANSASPSVATVTASGATPNNAGLVQATATPSVIATPPGAVQAPPGAVQMSPQP